MEDGLAPNMHGGSAEVYQSNQSPSMRRAAGGSP